MCKLTESMSKAEKRHVLSVNTTPELKERLKDFADSKRWSMSQAAEILIEEGLDKAESETKDKNAK